MVIEPQWASGEIGVDCPVLVFAFGGWGDAGSASTEVVNALLASMDSRVVATIDCDDFFDFTRIRPVTRRTTGLEREVSWPNFEVRLGTTADGRAALFVTGDEPHLRWRSFTAAVVDVARRCGVTTAIGMGSYLAEVSHTRPIKVYPASQDSELIGQFDIGPSNYEGPAGIVDVVADALSRAGIGVVTLRAAVPSYLPSQDCPAAASALLDALAPFVPFDPSIEHIHAAAVSYRHDADEFVANDPGTAEYVRRLEADAADFADPSEQMFDDLKRFLREH